MVKEEYSVIILGQLQFDSSLEACGDHAVCSPVFRITRSKINL